MYAVIAYMDTVAGVYFPRGGMRALPDAMAAAAADAGVEFIYGSTVSELEWSGSRVTAVRTAAGSSGSRRRRGADHRASRHVSTPGPDPASAAAVATGAVGRRGACRVPRRSTTGVGHHTILFGDAWQQTFRDIIDDGRVMGDPSLLVTRPTASDPTLAPPGRDLLYVLAPAPNTEVGKVNWDATLVGLRRADAGCGHGATAPTRRRRRSAVRGDTRRLGPSGHGGGHPVRVGAHLRPDRPVPAGQHRARRGQRGAGRLVDGAGCGGAHRGHVRAAGRRPDHRSTRTSARIGRCTNDDQLRTRCRRCPRPVVA